MAKVRILNDRLIYNLCLAYNKISLEGVEFLASNKWTALKEMYVNGIPLIYLIYLTASNLNPIQNIPNGLNNY
jgi:hypothetical protein